MIEKKQSIEDTPFQLGKRKSYMLALEKALWVPEDIARSNINSIIRNKDQFKDIYYWNIISLVDKKLIDKRSIIKLWQRWIRWSEKRTIPSYEFRIGYLVLRLLFDEAKEKKFELISKTFSTMIKEKTAVEIFDSLKLKPFDPIFS